MDLYTAIYSNIGKLAISNSEDAQKIPGLLYRLSLSSLCGYCMQPHCSYLSGMFQVPQSLRIVTARDSRDDS